jgi:glucose-1-phosphate cytidylyltransferase
MSSAGMRAESAVILCGGKGSRIYPFSAYFPKPMIPVKGRPILVHIMQIYATQGIRKFILAAGHRHEILNDYFDGRFREWKIEILDTGQETETADRIRSCLDHVDESFFVTYGDGVGNVDLSRLFDCHRNSGAAATVTGVRLRSPFGTLTVDSAGKVTLFSEKPTLDGCWINAGFFVFEREKVKQWKGHSLETEVLPQLAKEGELNTYLHSGFWRSLDTNKDQQQLEELASISPLPWLQASIVSRDAPEGNPNNE